MAQVAAFTGILRPSSAAEWGVGGCPAAPRMQETFPEPDGIEAREGTAAHHYATEGVLGRAVKLGDPAPNGIATDRDMIKGGSLFINAVLGRARLASETAMLRVETKVFGHKTIHPQNEGTPDAFILDAAKRRLDVFDYKYGFGYVTEFRNAQLMNYGAMILETSGFSREDTPEWEVWFHVIQPRYYSRDPVRSWKATAGEVWDFAEGLRIAAARATEPNAPAIAGPHCQHCTARIHCEAARQMAGHLMAFSSAGVPQGMDTAAQGVQLRNVKRAIKLLEAMEKGLEAELLVKAEAGAAQGSGWRRGNSRANRRWRDPAEVLVMGKLLGVDLAEEPTPISPFQAEALFKEKRLDPAVITAYAFTPTGKAKLVPDDETPAEQVFGSSAPVKPKD